MSTQKRVFIIHGWDSYQEEGIFPWLKRELENRGFIVKNPLMPEPLRPRIEIWVNYLKEQIGVPDENTILFGHSMGAQTVLRYLESLPKGVRVGGVVLLAGWVHLTDDAFEDEEDKITAKPWLETPINWDEIKQRTNKFIAIFSDNDPVIHPSNSEIFANMLGSKIVIEHNKGHFRDEDNIKELSSALESILEIAGEK